MDDRIPPEAVREHNDWVDRLIESIEGDDGEMFPPLKGFLLGLKFEEQDDAMA